VHLAFGEPGGRPLSHGWTITAVRIVSVARLSTFLRNPISFLFARSSQEERLSAYVIREHERGRPLAEILEDPYVRNRATPQELARLLDRPEVIRALGAGVVASEQQKLT
jgi:hypothetical protein